METFEQKQNKWNIKKFLLQSIRMTKSWTQIQQNNDLIIYDTSVQFNIVKPLKW